MAKETFQRTKPHVSIGTIGHVDHAKSMIVGFAMDQQSSNPRLWPSPHISTPQMTSKGRQQKVIMYPGAKTIAGPRIPGGLVLSNAIGASTSLSPYVKQTLSTMNQSLQFLALQNSLQMESRKFTALSNALKASQDAKSTSINNVW